MGGGVFRIVKGVGNVGAGIEILFTINDMGQNGVTVGNSVDLIMGGVTFIPGWGWIASGVYHLGKLAYPFAQDMLKEYNTSYPPFTPGYEIYHHCFEKGTLVYAKNGLVPIEDIRVDDSVYSYNIEKDTVELAKVLKTVQHMTGEIYQISTVNQTVKVTSEHPFYVEGKGWTIVSQLKIGDKLKTNLHNKDEKIMNIQIEKQSILVYNVEVDANHNYFVSNSRILVHNKYIRPYLIKDECKVDLEDKSKTK